MKAIASRPGTRRSRNALAAFRRDLHSTSEADRPELIDRALGRLDALAARIGPRDAAEPEKLQHRLGALEHRRERTVRSAET
ncbi:MAG: hypothetical protein M0004_17565 [Actinomycetota bacterium]|nr:hypothetical protein [Actinomycetota bacterium]